MFIQPMSLLFTIHKSLMSAYLKLLELPFPWNQTKLSIRREYLCEYLSVLSTDKTTIETALRVMECCLEASATLSFKLKPLPKQMEDNLAFFVERIARVIPELKQFEMARIERVLKEQKVRYISIDLLYDTYDTWNWSVFYCLGCDTISWCHKAIIGCPDPELVDRYLDIAKGYERDSISILFFKRLVAAICGAVSFRTPIIAGSRGTPLLAEWSRQEEAERAAQHARTLKMLGVDQSEQI